MMALTIFVTRLDVRLLSAISELIYLSCSLCFRYPFRDFCLKFKLRGKAAVINGVLGFCNNPVLIINLAFKSCYSAMHFGVEFCTTTCQRDGE